MKISNPPNLIEIHLLSLITNEDIAPLIIYCSVHVPDL